MAFFMLFPTCADLRESVSSHVVLICDSMERVCRAITPFVRVTSFGLRGSGREYERFQFSSLSGRGKYTCQFQKVCHKRFEMSTWVPPHLLCQAVLTVHRVATRISPGQKFNPSTLRRRKVCL